MLYKRALDLMNGFYNNKNTELIVKAYEELKERYGNIYIAGGSIVDCLYNKEFYDIDCFIYYKDMKADYNKANLNDIKSGIVDVVADTFNGISVDVVVVSTEVEKYIKNRFDMNLKKCYYNSSFVFSKSSLDDIRTNTLHSANINNISTFFRYVKTINKYKLNPCYEDCYLLYNYLNYKHYLNQPMHTSEKYKKYLDKFIKSSVSERDTLVASITMAVANYNMFNKHSVLFPFKTSWLKTITCKKVNVDTAMLDMVISNLNI